MGSDVVRYRRGELEAKILEFIARSGRVTVKSLSIALNRTATGVWPAMDKLLRAGGIVRTEGTCEHCGSFYTMYELRK